MKSATITVFTDGSSRGNPGPGGWGAIISTSDQVVELGGREDHTTNNRMELSAAINALVWIDENDFSVPVVLQTDSKYVIHGMTSWVLGWQKNGWRTAAKKEVENRDLWEALLFAASDVRIEWRYVRGHAGHPGNERCDEIATAYADNKSPVLYKGSRTHYPIDLDAVVSESVVSNSKATSTSAKVYSYVSFVDGLFMTHKTWKECESRVKGIRGARFKKAFSQADEERLKKEWTA